MSDSLAVPAERDASLAWSESTRRRLLEIRETLTSDDAETVYASRLWTEAVSAAARSKRAEDVAREAAETQVRLERRLGQLLPCEDLDLTPQFRVRCKELAGIPAKTFESVVADMAARGLQCKAHHVVTNARRHSMKRVETDIFLSHDGIYLARRPGGQGYTKHNSIDDARKSLGGKIHGRLDRAQGEARVLAQVVSQIRTNLSGDARADAERAEYLLGEVASLLHNAWRKAF